MPTLEDLVRLLPTATYRPDIIRQDLNVKYVIESDRNPAFISPPILEGKQIALGLTPVILFTAPAAVGKSTVAREMAFILGAPVWDLAGVSVGSRTLSGTLLEAFGIDEIADVVKHMRNGEFIVLIDSVEEAQLLSGNVNFEAFIRSICEFLKDTSGAPTLMFFARSEASTLLELHFEHYKVPFAHYPIDFFTEDHAQRFIHKQLDHHVKDSEGIAYNLHRHHQNLFSRARGTIFKQITDTLTPHADKPWGKPDVQRFLGYAPVLQAISRFLAVDKETDLKKLAEVLMAPPTGSIESGHRPAWVLLDTIVRELLRREQTEKVAKGLKARFADMAKTLGWADWNSLYSIEEQLQRLANYIYDDALFDVSREDLPIEIRKEYQDSVTAFLTEHPFLLQGTRKFINSVFDAYFHAWAVTQDDHLVSEYAREEFLEPSYHPSAMLAYFLVLFSTKDGRVRISANDIGVFYEAFASQALDHGELYLDIHGHDSGEVDGIIGIRDMDQSNIAFDIDDIDDGLFFPRALGNAYLNTRCTVIFGARNNSFKLGPSVIIECKKLKLDAADFLIAVPPEGDVFLQADRFEFKFDQKLNWRGEGSIVVRSETPVKAPWSVFYRKEIIQADEDERVDEAFLYLTRILRKFRARNYGDMGRLADHVDGWIVGGTKMARAMRDHMLDKDLMYQAYVNGRRYFLNDEEVEKLGLTYDDIVNRKLSEPARSFIVKFLEKFDRGEFKT